MQFQPGAELQDYMEKKRLGRGKDFNSIFKWQE